MTPKRDQTLIKRSDHEQTKDPALPCSSDNANGMPHKLIESQAVEKMVDLDDC